MMARIISNADSNLFKFSHETNVKALQFRTSLRNQPIKRKLKFRVFCSIKEREREDFAEKQRTLNGLEVKGQLKEKESVGEVEYGDGKVGFDMDWPPWKNLPQRYKLIGTTSLAFVICNMDKVINLLVSCYAFSFDV